MHTNKLSFESFSAEVFLHSKDYIKERLDIIDNNPKFKLFIDY